MKHRFSGGALALDLVNTVVRRGDASRVLDRLASAADANLFAEAAVEFRTDELARVFEFTPISDLELGKLLELRERIYAYVVLDQENDAARLLALSQLLGASERALADCRPNSLLVQTVFSWMRLNAREKRARMRACPACGWIFLDKSRNASRIWCDMAVCGNRRKSKLNYDRKRRAARQKADAA